MSQKTVWRILKEDIQSLLPPVDFAAHLCKSFFAGVNRLPCVATGAASIKILRHFLTL
jgi:hypothetical protein